MNGLFLVMLGGALGAGARYALSQLMAARIATSFPWATFSANVLGSLAMGILMGWLARGGGSETARLFVGVGLLGGFTTFSSFSLEFWMLFERGQTGAAFAYAALSVVGALMACSLGFLLFKQVAA